MTKELRSELMRDEGFRDKPYRCTSGKLTIGYGRNLEDRGITKAEAEFLLDNDIRQATRDAQEYPWFWDLSDARQNVVIEMLFQLGAARFAKFKKTLAAIAAQDFELAASEMKNSHWARQTPKRALRLAEQMRNGH